MPLVGRQFGQRLCVTNAAIGDLNEIQTTEHRPGTVAECLGQGNWPDDQDRSHGRLSRPEDRRRADGAGHRRATALDQRRKGPIDNLRSGTAPN